MELDFGLGIWTWIVTIKKNIPEPNNEVAARPVDVRRARARAVNAVTKKRGHISVFCVNCLPDNLFSSPNHLLKYVPLLGALCSLAVTVMPSIPDKMGGKTMGKPVTFTQKPIQLVKILS